MHALVALFRHLARILKRGLLSAQWRHHSFFHYLGHAHCARILYLALEGRRALMKTDIIDLRRHLLIRLKPFLLQLRYEFVLHCDHLLNLRDVQLLLRLYGVSL